jgi:hypothetical protein
MKLIRNLEFKFQINKKTSTTKVLVKKSITRSLVDPAANREIKSIVNEKEYK